MWQDLGENWPAFLANPVVRHLVEGFIPDEEIKRLDFSTLERMNASYVSEDLRSSTTTAS